MKKSPILETIFAKRDLSLSAREIEVLKLYAYGKTYGEIGEELEISPTTAGSYLQSIRIKIRAKSRADVVAAALNHGFLDSENNCPKSKC